MTPGPAPAPRRRVYWRNWLLALARRLAFPAALLVLAAALPLAALFARDLLRLVAQGQRLPWDGYNWNAAAVWSTVPDLVLPWALGTPRTLLNPEEPGEATRLPVYQLWIRQEELDRLDRDLPYSGREEVRAFLEHDGKVERVRARHRGLTAHHWAAEKKSWRLRLRKGRFLDGERWINFINPEGMSQSHNLLADRLAAELGLLEAEGEFVHLRLNRRFGGVYYKQAQLGEGFLRRRGWPPGELFEGEGMRGNKDRWGPLRDLWTDPLAWDKAAWTSDLTRDDFRPIEQLIALVRDAPDEEFARRIWTLLDRDTFLRFVTLHDLVGSRHSDNRHNWRLYLDPVDGRFRAIPWDLDNQLRVEPLDHPSSRLHERVFHLDPDFVEERNRLLWRFLRAGGEARMRSILEQARAKALPDLLAERYKGRWLGPGFVPLTNEELLAAIAKEPHQIRAIVASIEQQLSDSALDAYFEPAGNGVVALTLVPHGRSGVLLREVSLLDGDRALAPVGVARDVAGGRPLVLAGESRNGLDDELLLPGRTPQLNPDGSPGHGEDPSPVLITVGADGERVRRAVDREKMARERAQWRIDPEPRQYRYLLSGLNALPSSVRLRVENSVTGASRWLEALPQAPPAGLVRGEFRPRPPRREREVRFDRGRHRVEESLLLGPGEHLVIAPGAELELLPGVSILTREPYRIEGTPAEPVVLAAADPERPWGALACLCEGHGPSIVRHARIAGGSEATSGLVRVSGMVSVYRGDLVVEDAVLLDSRGEDMVNVKFGTLEMRDTVLARSHSDLVDVDFGTARVERTVLLDSTNDCIDFGQSKVEVVDSVLLRCGDKAVSIGPQGDVRVLRTKIEGPNIGVAVKDGSKAAVEDSQIASCRTSSVLLYRKNLQYPGGETASVRRTTFLASQAPQVDDRDGRLELTDCRGSWIGEPHGAVRGRLAPHPPDGDADRGRLWLDLADRAALRVQSR